MSDSWSPSPAKREWSGKSRSASTKTGASILVERDGPVLILTLNRPEVLNALDQEMFQGLVDALLDAQHDDGVGAVVLTGQGRAFSAGADLRMIGALSEAGYASLMNLLRELAMTIRGLSKPVIAAVNGYAMAGGFELACLCDVRIADSSARFAVGDAEVNLTPTSGLTWLLPRLVGLGAANYLALSGETVDASFAKRIGLVQEVTEPESLLYRSLELAAHMAALPPTARALTKASIYAGSETTHEASFESELRTGARCFAEPETGRRVALFLNGSSSNGSTSNRSEIEVPSGTIIGAQQREADNGNWV